MNCVITDPALGRLTFNEGLNWFEGELLSGSDGAVRITFSLDTWPSADAAIADAWLVLPLVFQSVDAAKQFACEKLLALKNEAWLGESEQRIFAEDFVTRLAVEAVGIYLGRECEVFLKDGGLFSGHTVLLSWNPANGFYDANIAGYPSIPVDHHKWRPLNINVECLLRSKAKVRCGSLCKALRNAEGFLPTGRGTVTAAPIGVRAPRPPGKKPSALCAFSRDHTSLSPHRIRRSKAGVRCRDFLQYVQGLLLQTSRVFSDTAMKIQFESHSLYVVAW